MLTWSYILCDFFSLFPPFFFLCFGASYKGISHPSVIGLIFLPCPYFFGFLPVITNCHAATEFLNANGKLI